MACCRGSLSRHTARLAALIIRVEPSDGGSVSPLMDRHNRKFRFMAHAIAATSGALALGLTHPAEAVELPPVCAGAQVGASTPAGGAGTPGALRCAVAPDAPSRATVRQTQGTPDGSVSITVEVIAPILAE